MDIQALAETARSLWVVWLGLIFLGIVFWALRPANAKRFHDAARIPLDDDAPKGRGRRS